MKSNSYPQIKDLSIAEFQRLVESARDYVLSTRLFQPQIGIVLGSGLGGLSSAVLHPHAIAYASIPGFVATHAQGHAGKLILGFLSGMPVVLMQGRCHRYEGHSQAQVQFPIHVMHALGVKSLIVTNAAGGLNSRFQVGDLMVIDSHIDMLWMRRQWSHRPLAAATARELLGDQVLRGSSPYCPKLLRRAKVIANLQSITLQQGCYLGTLGPTYETRSEYRCFRWMGADAVGMSTIPEVLAANALGMQVLAFSVITNVASTDLPAATTHDEVVQSGNQAGPRLQSIIARLLSEMSGQPD